MSKRLTLSLSIIFIMLSLIGCGGKNATSNNSEETAGSVPKEATDTNDISKPEQIKKPQPDGEYLQTKESRFTETGELFYTIESFYDLTGKKTFDTYTYFNSQSMKDTFKSVGQTIPDSYGFTLAYDYSNSKYPISSRTISGTDVAGNHIFGGYSLYTYDEYGNLIESAEYDENNHLSHLYRMEYDDNHNCTGDYSYNGDREIIQSTKSVYNPEGFCLSWETKSGSAVSTGTHEYQKNTAGNIVQLNYTNGTYHGSATYEYDNHGNLLKLTRKDASGNISGWSEYEYVALADYSAKKEQNALPDASPSPQHTSPENTSSKLGLTFDSTTSGKDNATKLMTAYYRENPISSLSCSYIGKTTDGLHIFGFTNPNGSVNQEYQNSYFSVDLNKNQIFFCIAYSERSLVWKNGVSFQPEIAVFVVEDLTGAPASYDSLAGDDYVIISNNMCFNVSWDRSKVYLCEDFLSSERDEIYPTDTIGFFSPSKNEAAPEQSVSADDKYAGYYSDSEESSVTICNQGDFYSIELYIFRLICIDDAVSKNVDGNTMTFYSSGGGYYSIAGEITWSNDYKDICVTFTDSASTYLPSGTQMYFHKE